jgi:hypothetical protein
MTAPGPIISGDTRHRVRLFLPALLVVTLAYPVSLLHPATAIGYALCYVGVFALGARVASVTRRRTVAATGVAATIALLVVPWMLRPDVLWLSLITYILFIFFHMLVMFAIGEFLLEAPEVDRDVIFAGTSLYVLAGNMFIPASMLVDQLSVELTGASAYAGGPVAWHDMVYFSFTTLTTLGYGDIAPVNPVSQALAIAEAILGVLTVALIIGRLVGAATGVRRRHEREHGA